MCMTWISVCCGHLCSSIISGSDEHCKSFKWLDGIPCRRGAETAPIVIAKFSRLEAEAAMAKNNEMEARAIIADLLHKERVAKRSAEKARVSLCMANARACKYQIALLMSWLAVVVLFIFHLVIGRLDYDKCVCHDSEFGLVVCIMKFYYVVSVGVGPGNVCVERQTYCNLIYNIAVL